MSQLYSWWPQVKSVVKQKPGNFKIDWLADRSHFPFFWSHIWAQKIILFQLKLKIICEAKEVKSQHHAWHQFISLPSVKGG
jgi:hypothetical protein